MSPLTHRKGSVAVGAACSLLLTAQGSRAWYFPEHTELTRLGLRDHAPAFVTEEIDRVLGDARALGLMVCPEASTTLASLPATGDHVECVPYGALAAIAADHANDVTELESELKVPVSRLWPGQSPPLALLLTEAAQQTWKSFEAHAPAEVLRIWTVDVDRLTSGIQQLPTAVNPHDSIRALDAELLAIDPGYVSRAAGAKTHFHDPTSDPASTLAAAAAGDVDNALAQLMAHHMRSLELAALSVEAETPLARQRLRVSALLEHAFALHFMEDGFAAGHIATDPAVVVDERRAQRHDYFNRQGLAVTRALTGRRCEELSADDQTGNGLFPCWTAHGDGFASAVDRLYVGEAAARLQTALALALRDNSKDIVDAATNDSDCQGWLAGESAPGVGCDLAWTAFLLDPGPKWARRACDTKPEEMVESARHHHRRLPSRREWAARIVTNFTQQTRALSAHAMTRDDQLRSWLRPANAGLATAQLHVIDPDELGRPIGPNGACERYSADSAGAVLWRPVLMAWPEAQADVTTIAGADAFGRGLDTQVLASLAGSYSGWFKDSASLMAWGGLGGGLAYTATNAFPHRKTRALIELNAGVAVGARVAGLGPRFRSLGVAELRAPATTLLCYGAGLLLGTRYPLAIVGDRWTLGLFGGRAYFALDEAGMRVNGWDLEVLDVVLGDSGQVTSASRSGFLDSEVRFRFGVRSLDPSVRLGSRSNDAWVISSELNSGFFTSFLK